MAGRRKDVMDSAMTLHLTVKERTNLVLLELAKEKEVTKSKVIEELLKESPSFNKKMKKLQEIGLIG